MLVIIINWVLQFQDDDLGVIGWSNNWGEPEWAVHDGSAVRELYIIIMFGTCVTRCAAPYLLYSGRTRRHGVDNF